jgi:hypothetical protein
VDQVTSVPHPTPFDNILTPPAKKPRVTDAGCNFATVSFSLSSFALYPSSCKDACAHEALFPTIECQCFSGLDKIPVPTHEDICNHEAKTQLVAEIFLCGFTAWCRKHTVLMNVSPRARFITFTGRCPVMYRGAFSCMNDPILIIAYVYRWLCLGPTWPARSSDWAAQVHNKVLKDARRMLQSRTHQECLSQDVEHAGCEGLIPHTAAISCCASTHGQQPEIVNVERSDAVNFQPNDRLAQVRALEIDAHM